MLDESSSFLPTLITHCSPSTHSLFLTIPDQGAAVVVANIRRKNERKWTRLTWSLRESLVRIFSKENEKEELKQRQKMNKNISKTVQTGA